jgi:hypothetical protein
MIHVVFNEPDVQVLQQAIALDESLAGEVCLIRDDYAVGPLQDVYLGEGREARRLWWKDVLAGGDYDGKADTGEVDDLQVAANLVGTLRRDENEIIYIWAAQNKHDVCGYYWLLHFMKEFQGRVYILYLNNLPFINEKGNIFYPTQLHEIQPKEFLKARKLARPITLSEFEVDPDEWLKLCSEGKFVRILEGGKKLVQFDVDFYDNDLKKFVTGDWQKASKIINQYQSKAKHNTGDAFLLWRLKTLLQAGNLDAQGKIAGMKDFELKLKTAGELVNAE